MNILDRLVIVQQLHLDLIRLRLKVREEYGLSSFFRRSSNSEAQNRGIKDRNIYRNNRLRKVERAGARKPKLKMRDHYTDVLVSFESFLRYSQVL